MKTLREAVLPMHRHMLKGLIQHFDKYLRGRFGYHHVWDKNGPIHRYRWINNEKGQHFEIVYDERNPYKFFHRVMHIDKHRKVPIINQGAGGVDNLHDYYRRYVKIPPNKLFRKR